MATASVFLWHDREGSITAVGQPAPGCENRVEPLASDAIHVLRVEIDERLLLELHRTHRVDLDHGALVARSSETP